MGLFQPRQIAHTANVFFSQLCVVGKTVAIVHYNTPELTAALIRSVAAHTPGAGFVVFDNSDHRPFATPDGICVEVIDNTKGQYINFEAWLQRHPDKIPTACNWGSEKHILSVQWLWDYLWMPFLLMDSDVLALQDLSPLADEGVAWVGEVERDPKFWFQAQRLFPHCLWINVPMCEAAGVRFAREGYIYKGSHKGIPFYDTGGSFYRECRRAGLPGREIRLAEWVVHFGGASCYGTLDAEVAWLKEHQHLYING